MSLAGPYIRKYVLPFLAALAFLSVESICDLLQPTIVARIVDEGVAAHDIGIVLRLGLMMLGVATVGGVGAASRNIISSIVSHRFAARLRLDVFRRIASFSFEDLDTYDTASLITRQTNDITQVRNFVNGVMRVFAKAPILAVGSLVMTIILEPRLALVLAVVVPAAGVLIAISLRMGYPRFRRVQEGLDRVNTVSREFLGGIRVVKAFGQEEREVERFSEANAELTGASMRAIRVMALFGPAISLTVNLAIVAVLWFGGLRVGAGSLQVGKVIALVNYMTRLLFSLTMISRVFTFFVRAKASWERVSEVLGRPGSEPFDNDEAQAASLRPVRRATPVRFESVSFRYPNSGGARVLEAVDLECSPGSITAIIGSTGSGKSSLAALVPRFYDATEGVVRVGGEDVRDIDLYQLRRRIALVPQKTVLFTGTIEENIRWGREDATPEELEAAARTAEAHEFIVGFPEGYASLLGQGGVNLSGGQKQRVAITRALIREPEVLILDDCTSSVDSITEARILAAIREWAASLTCILITQRVSAAAASDRVLVLDEGRAVGVGPHARLIRECAVYRDICTAQLGKEAVDGP